MPSYAQKDRYVKVIYVMPLSSASLFSFLLFYIFLFRSIYTCVVIIPNSILLNSLELLFVMFKNHDIFVLLSAMAFS